MVDTLKATITRLAGFAIDPQFAKALLHIAKVTLCPELIYLLLFVVCPAV